MNTTTAITYPISVEITTPPIEMISLMTTEATKAPTMFPRPPSTQIMKVRGPNAAPKNGCTEYWMMSSAPATPAIARSEEHTSELQSRPHLVCRLLLEKKNNHTTT